jgi:small subunit ribosomal protein S4
MSKVTMGHKSRFKIQRRLGVELPGLGKPGALDRRDYGPGQHGQGMRRKLSDFAIRLREKQKILYNYGLRERQLRLIVKRSKRDRTKEWIEIMAGMLELRLDSVVFRLGFAPSMAAARQLVVHRNVLVNGQKRTIPSMVLKVGDRVSLTPTGYKSAPFLQARSNARMEMPNHLGKIVESGNPVGIVNEIPGSEAIPFPFEKRYFIEHFGRISL